MARRRKKNLLPLMAQEFADVSSIESETRFDREGHNILIALSRTVIGRAVHIENKMPVPEDILVPESEREAELKKFEDAHKQAISLYVDEEDAAKDIPEDLQGMRSVSEMQMMERLVCEDHKRLATIRKFITEGKTAARAVYDHWKPINDRQLMMTGELAEKLRAHPFKAAAYTLNFLGHPMPSLDHLGPGDIPVISSLPSGQVSTLIKKGVKGIINTEGTRNDHAGLLLAGANTVRAIVSEDVAAKIPNGSLIVLDGPDQMIIVDPTDATRMTYDEVISLQTSDHKALHDNAQHMETKTRDGVDMSVCGNLAFSTEGQLIDDNHGDGIGLYRTEIGILNHGDVLTAEKCFKNFKCVGESVRGSVFYIRTVDFVGDKKASFSESEEMRIVRNQMIGALKARNHFTQNGTEKVVRLMIPNIENESHLQYFQAIMDEEAEKLGLDSMRLGAMAEKVSYVDCLAHYKGEPPAFLSVGTNDLSADVLKELGYDRFNPDTAHLYDPTNPKLLDKLVEVAKFGKAQDIPISVCGDMASSRDTFAIMVGCGYDQFSVGADAIPLIKEFVRRIDTRAAKNLVENLRHESDRDKRREMLEAFNQKYLGLHYEGTFTPPEQLPKHLEFISAMPDQLNIDTEYVPAHKRQRISFEQELDELVPVIGLS